MILIITSQKELEMIPLQFKRLANMIIETNGKSFKYVKNRFEYDTKKHSNYRLNEVINQQIRKEIIETF
jgi:hypothetical protein